MSLGMDLISLPFEKNKWKFAFIITGLVVGTSGLIAIGEHNAFGQFGPAQWASQSGNNNRIPL